MIGRSVKPRLGDCRSNEIRRCRDPVLGQWHKWAVEREEGVKEEVLRRCNCWAWMETAHCGGGGKKGVTEDAHVAELTNVGSDW